MVGEINSTQSALSSFVVDNGGLSWFGTVIMVAIVVMVVGLFIGLLSNFRVYYKSRKAIDSLIKSVYFFLWGLFFSGILGVIGLIFYYFFDNARKGNVVPLWITGAIILGYVIITIIGWFGKKYVFERIKIFEIKYQNEEGVNEGETNGNV